MFITITLYRYFLHGHQIYFFFRRHKCKRKKERKKKIIFDWFFSPFTFCLSFSFLFNIFNNKCLISNWVAWIFLCLSYHNLLNYIHINLLLIPFSRTMFSCSCSCPYSYFIFVFSCFNTCGSFLLNSCVFFCLIFLLCFIRHLF